MSKPASFANWGSKNGEIMLFKVCCFPVWILSVIAIGFLRSITQGFRGKEKWPVGYVYLVRAGNYHKIGYTTNLEKRLQALQTGSPETIIRVHVWETDSPIELEAYYHQMFAHKRHSGEWFKLNASDIRKFKQKRRSIQPVTLPLSRPQPFNESPVDILPSPSQPQLLSSEPVQPLPKAKGAGQHTLEMLVSVFWILPAEMWAKNWAGKVIAAVYWLFWLCICSGLCSLGATGGTLPDVRTTETIEARVTASTLAQTLPTPSTPIETPLVARKSTQTAIAATAFPKRQTEAAFVYEQLTQVKATEEVREMTASRTPRPSSTVTPIATITLTATMSPQTRYATTSVNVRSCASIDCRKITSLSFGESFFATGRTIDVAGQLWYSFDFGGETVWVAGWYTSAEQPLGAATSSFPSTTQPTTPEANSSPMISSQSPDFACDCSKTCLAIVTCEEAYFQLNQCGCSLRDLDGDGVPCESICPGG